MVMSRRFLFGILQEIRFLQMMTLQWFDQTFFALGNDYDGVRGG